MRKPNRLTKYDYTKAGYYFVTVCALNRTEYFGAVENSVMILNNLGKIAEDVWRRAGLIYPNVTLDEFVVMPNHMHGIIVIEDVGQARGLQPSLSQIIGSYKNVVSKNIRNKLDKQFAWQPSFYDHVIRKDGSLDKIREYIKNNPLKWELDRNNPENLWM
jgi:REP element-mobilizing transposase RayT